jgi:hypothetical protein
MECLEEREDEKMIRGGVWFYVSGVHEVGEGVMGLLLP